MTNINREFAKKVAEQMHQVARRMANIGEKGPVTLRLSLEELTHHTTLTSLRGTAISRIVECFRKEGLALREWQHDYLLLATEPEVVAHFKDLTELAKCHRWGNLTE